MRQRPDGTWELYGNLDQERGAEISSAIRAMARGPRALTLRRPDDTIHREIAPPVPITRRE